MAVKLVCVRAFGTYHPGDDAGEVPDDAVYDTDYFAPVSAPPGKKLTAKEQREAELQAELDALEKENG